MPQSPQKTHLLSALEHLVPVWDFAKALLETVSRDDFPEDEIDELLSIVTDATAKINSESRHAEAVEIQKRIRDMYERERQHRENDHHHATEHLHHIL